MLILDDNQQLVGEAVARLLAARDPLAERARLRGAGAGFCPDLWAQCVELGLAGLLVPEALGGAGLGIGEAVVASMAFGRALAPSPFFATGVLGGALLPALAADSAVVRAHLPAVVAGTTLFALAEPATPADVRLREAPEGWRLDGRVAYVADGAAAGLLAVVAAGPAGPMLACVAMPAAGAVATPRRLVDERDGAALAFDGCVLPAAAVIPAGGHLDRLRHIARLCLAGEMLGLAEAALAMTLEHVRQRRQFGRAVGSFQAVQHQLAALHCDLELLRSAVLGGIAAIDTPGFAAAAALAKAKANRAGPQAANTCLQLHGGVGMTDAFAIGHYLKRAKVIARSFGDEDACLHTLTG